MPISKDLFDDNLHGVWAEDVKQFALMARVSQDLNAFEVYRGAFATTLCADAVAFISAFHALIGGGTTSNLVAAPSQLSRTTLETATVGLRQQVNQRGVVLGGVPSILLVPPALWITAIQITESALISGSAQNDLNVFRSAYGITVYQSPYLGTAVAGGAGLTAGSDTAWFLLTNNHSVTRLIRQGVETALTPWQYSNNRTYNYQANYRESYFVPDYAGAYGATGLNS
jgi:phage major head subunit gpT-like protein